MGFFNKILSSIFSHAPAQPNQPTQPTASQTPGAPANQQASTPGGGTSAAPPGAATPPPPPPPTPPAHPPPPLLNRLARRPISKPPLPAVEHPQLPRAQQRRRPHQQP